jgi:REP element-mobilizing transposase RayT
MSSGRIPDTIGFATLFAEKLGFSDNRPTNKGGFAAAAMFKVTRDNPAYYLTSVTHHRLPVFQHDAIKQIVCRAFEEARKNHRLKLFAYVIMPDHTHVVTDSVHAIADTLRYLNGVSAKRVIDHLKEHGFESSLAKLRIQERGDRQKYSVYEHHPNALRITGERSLWQKVQYIHLNPVRAGIVDHPNDYRFSSARLWHGRPAEDEPLLTDHQDIDWRQ